MLELSPTEWAVRWASSHSSVLILSGQSSSRMLVVEDLGGRAGQRAQTGVAQAGQVGGQRLVEPPGPLGHLQGGEPVDVHVGHRVLHRPGHVDVVVAVEAGVDAALQAHLGGPELGGLDGAPGDVVEGEQVRRAPQVQRQRALGEAAEAALEGAHVGVVDVAVVHEGDGVAHHLATQLVGHLGHRRHLGTPGREQGDDLVDAHFLAHQHAGQHLAHRPGGPRLAGHQPGRLDRRRRSTRPCCGRRCGAPRCRRRPVRAWPAGGVARTPNRDRRAPAPRRRCGPSPRSAWPDRASGRALEDVLRVDGQPGSQARGRGPR